MPEPTVFKLQTGPMVWSALEEGAELGAAVARLAARLGLANAVFDVSGRVSSATVGVYDSAQQVWVTEKHTQGADILFCQGNLLQADQPVVSGQILLADPAGRIYGGRLFADTIVQAAEIRLVALSGKAPQRIFDPVAALWRLTAPL